MPFRSTDYIVLGLIFGLYLGACQTESESRDDRLAISTSLPIFGSIIEELIQDKDVVFVLLGEQGSPHNYQPRPSDILNLERGDILILGDPDLDGWASKLSGAEVLFLSELLPDQSIMETNGHRNPHFWMDPLLVRDLSRPLADLLCQVREAGCETYKRRATEFTESLASLDRKVAGVLSKTQISSVITSHPFFDYFLARYQINSIITLEPVPGQEPSTALIVESIQIALKEQPSGLIANADLPDAAIDLIRQETNLPLIYLNPAGRPGQSYDEFILMSAMRVSDLNNNSPHKP